MQVATTIAHTLYPVFKGNIVLKCLNGFYHATLREQYLPRFGEDIYEAVDRNYSVIPFKENPLKIPRTLVAVAKAKESS